MQEETRKRTKVVDYAEAYDKNGHWFRLVPARGQTGWLWVERWASDNRYRLVAAKSSMRVYRKEVGLGGIWHYVEIRLRESRLRVASWLEVDSLARMIRLFRIPTAMVIEPVGFWGIRAKRSACRLLNDLLARFDQEPIIGSTKFHPADWDPSTWILSIGAVVLSAYSLLAASAASEFRIAMIDDNFLVLLKPGAILFGVSWAVLLIYEKVIVRRWETLFPKMLGMFFVLGSIAGAGWALVSPTQMDFVHARVRYHCVEVRTSSEACQAAAAGLPDDLRLHLVRQLKPKSSKVR